MADLSESGSVEGPYDFTALGGWIYFGNYTEATGGELWRTDGTTTELVKDISPGEGSSWPGEFKVFGGTLYFEATTPGAVSYTHLDVYKRQPQPRSGG